MITCQTQFQLLYVCGKKSEDGGACMYTSTCMGVVIPDGRKAWIPGKSEVREKNRIVAVCSKSWKPVKH